ncbi:membrane protein [Desulfuromonas versatilis]|uniref:Membrane protein n=1 Tax=Desulfuromonas versatilis TaxID=2802975 RepID=A0ABM8I1Y1_9BACT|nr:thioredoxin family protein [Desulfuromonas versatilis]BCR06829.1 membrane protein [Desulfuromonas versatilis]
MRVPCWRLLFLVLLILPCRVLAQGGSGEVRLHYFWTQACPHCAEATPFLETLRSRYPQLRIQQYDVWSSREHFDLMVQLSKAAGSSLVSTPTIAIGGRVWSGFSAAVAGEIEEQVVRCLAEGCPDPLPGPAAAEAPPSRPERPAALGGEEPPRVEVPLLGALDADALSLPLFTVVLGLLDSFNPCAFFVLFFLLSLLVHAKRRRTMLLVGGTFVCFSGLIYFLFMSAWLNLFLLAGQLRAITALAGVVALVVAAINIKDFFFFHRGLSLSIPEGAKPRLFQRMRGLLQAGRTSSILFGTVVLAVAANSYELLCTAGFPMVYTRVLTLHDLAGWQHYAFLALYNLVYVVPLLVIVLAFTLTLGSKKLSEWHGRVLKLVSGLMMLLLGAVLLARPALLNNLLTAVALLALALAAAGVIVVVCRQLEKRAGQGRMGQ